MKLVIADTALRDLQAATAYYSSQANLALGRNFVAEFERVVNFLALNPNLGAIWRDGRRRHPLRRFPYTVIYSIDVDTLLVVAVAHQRRRPGYWNGRQ